MSRDVTNLYKWLPFVITRSDDSWPVVEEHFYVDPQSRELVWRWSEERLVLVDSESLRSLESKLLGAELRVQELLTVNERLAEHWSST